MIAPHIVDELQAAGLLGLPFAWGTDGALSFGPTLTAPQRAAIAAVFAAHDPLDAAKIAAYAARQQEADLDAQRLVKAVALWCAQQVGVAPAVARSEILALYRGLP
jgi:hypothetical protein